MTKTNFDIDSFVLSMTNQVEGVIPSDVNQETKDYIICTMDSFLRIAYDGINNDPEFNFSKDETVFFLQVIAEWLFHKTVDLSRGNVPIEYWDSVLQKIAFTIYEIEKQALVKKLEENVLLQTVEVHVKKIYEKELQELFDNKKITKEIYEAAIAESNIDKMADEREKIKIKHKSFKKDFGFKKLTTFITDLLQNFKTKKDLNSALTEIKDLRKQMQDLVNPDKQYESLGVDILRLEVGAGLLCIADPDQEGWLLANIAALRQQLAEELGYIIPSVRIIDNKELEPNEYQILVREQVIASGYVYPDKYMVNADAWDSQVGEIPEGAIVSVAPTECVQCYCIDKKDVEKYPNIVADKPEVVITKHLKSIVIRYVDLIISTCDIEKYIKRAEKEENSEKFIERLQERLELEDLRKIFVNLIREQVSIKDIIYVFDKLSEFSKYTADPNILSERLRASFGLNICLKHSKDGVLYALNLSAEWEEILDSALQRTETGAMFLITPMQLQELVEATAMSLMMAHQEIGFQPVIICPPKIRLPLYELLVRHIPSIVVMSHSELVQEIKVEFINEIKYDSEILGNNDIEEIQDDEEFYEQEPLLGRVIDSDGKPLDGGIENYSLEEMFSEIAPADSSEPTPITKIFKTGVRAVDAFITIGCGQKMGVFAQSGCGLSTFLGLILKNSEADINIVSLVADSVEIAWDFINNCVKSNPSIQRKTIVICSTPIDSAEKIKKNFETAVSLCEYYRDKGKNVLFINDKTEPILNAAEKIAWESGEPTVENDYRLTVTSWYQRLINRCKSNDNGTITTILATNITSLDKGNAAVNTIRKAAQGHIFLSRKVAEQNIYPAIDISCSISRSHINLACDEHKRAATTIRKILSLYREGSKDEFVLKKYNEVVSFIQQRVSEKTSLEETLQSLVQLAKDVS